MSRQLGSLATELSVTSPKVVLRLIIVTALFAMLCFISPLTHAATQIMLGEGYEVRFDSGEFDPETFNMQITNFEVFKDGERYWNADAISLKTILLSDGRTLIVKNLKIDGFISLIDELKVGSIIVRNVTLDKYDHLLAGEIGSLSDHALNDTYVGMFDFLAPIERGVEYDTFFQFIELTPVRRTTLPSGSSYFNQIGMRGVITVKHRRLHYHNKVPKFKNIAGDELLTQLNLKKFDIAFELENSLIEEGGIMRSKFSGLVDIKNHFSSDIEFDFQMPLKVFREFMRLKESNNGLNAELSDEFVNSFLQSGAELSKVSLGFRDYGTFDRLLNLYAKQSGQSTKAATEDIRLKIDQGIKENISYEGLDLFPAIDQFLNNGGQLRLSATPDAPVPFLLLASYLLMPERAIKQLNVTIEQLN